jgi:carbamoyltransferase
MRVLGISCWYHDAAVCLVEDGEIVAAAQEERFTRVKHDAAFPTQALRYCLAEAGASEIDAVAFYDKPILKLHRILETSLSTAPRGVRPFVRAVPSWLREKLWIEPRILEGLRATGVRLRVAGDRAASEAGVLFPEHHLSHAASAFYPSPFDEAAVLTIDGVGEWASATIGHGRGAHLELLHELDFPHSLGLLYSAFTYFTGFEVNGGEYKLMGLAPFGEGRHTGTILERLMDLKDDGSFRLEHRYFGYLDDLEMTSAAFAELFGGPPRSPGARITRREMDLARSIQEVTEEVVLRMARHARALTGSRRLCLAGGVALNCVANGRLVRERVVDELWIQPGAGDCGGAIGAAYAAYHARGGLPAERPAPPRHGPQADRMQGAYLGPEFSPAQIGAFLDANAYPYRRFDDDEAWAAHLAALLAEQKVVGLFQGRMEFGPRALGGRSIIGDPRSPKMQAVMNVKIKFRESFRPFAPTVLRDHVAEWFDHDGDSPYMLLVAPVREERRVPLPDGADELWGIEKLNVPRSSIPAVTHVDYSARIQTVRPETHGLYHDIIAAFHRQTGCPVVVNTSFNVRGEPIVCTPEDAYRCFMRTDMDTLVLENFILDKSAQPAVERDESWKLEFALD